MGTVRRALMLTCVALLVDATTGTTQVTPRVEDLTGTWELVSTKDTKTGVVTRSLDIEWLQLTRSHWTSIRMSSARKAVTPTEFAKMSADAQVKANYARIWDERNQQVFAARGGTYSLVGDKLHHPATMAIYSNIIGIDRVLKIKALDKTTLVAETEYPDNPTERSERTYRRID